MGPRFWYVAAFFCLALSVVLALLADDEVVPPHIGGPLAVGVMLVGGGLFVPAYRIKRKRDWDMYRGEGFVVGPRTLDSIDARLPFAMLTSRGRSNYVRAWLPEAPQVYIYPLYKRGRFLGGHVLAMPTAAPRGVLARGFSNKEVEQELRLPGDLVAGEDGLVGSEGDVRSVLAEALPPHPGILQSIEGRAHWLTYEPLTPDQIKEAIACLQRLPARDHDHVQSTKDGA